MSTRLHISGCHLSLMLSQIYRCESGIPILHPQTHILTPASSFQKMAKYLGAPLTLLFVSHPTSNLSGSPVDSSLILNLTKPSPRSSLAQSTAGTSQLSPSLHSCSLSHLLLHTTAQVLFLKHTLNTSLVAQNSPTSVLNRVLLFKPYPFYCPWPHPV